MKEPKSTTLEEAASAEQSEDHKLTEQRLKDWKPGVNYPGSVEVTEPDGNQIKFLMQSYFVGMYCAIYFPGSSQPHQTGDHDNTGFSRKLKKDLKNALARGAKVVISSLRPVKKHMD